jgi:hypothetical protein
MESSERFMETAHKIISHIKNILKIIYNYNNEFDYV